LNYRIVSGINANVQYDAPSALHDLARQTCQMIQFDRVISVLTELGASIILEVGPGKALSHIIQQQNLPIIVKSIDDFKNFSEIANWVNSKR
ncbi:MAG: hypothetical protein K2Q14_08220, partial [Gammaproteobacteria bacterium]|nr:hypothetical protein [Gammaproteobacteria bacterium]